MTGSDVAEVFADPFAAVEIAVERMVLDEELVTALGFVRREGADRQVFEDVLFVRRGLAVSGCLEFG